jgi:hypothetical protein
MELAESQADENVFRQRVEDKISRLQLEVTLEKRVSRSGPVSAWKEVNLYANAAYKLFERRTRGRSSPGTVKSIETLLESPNSLLVGKPDLLEISGREASLVDYKSSEISTIGVEKAELYREQCVYYSALIFEVYDVDIVAASIVSPHVELMEWKITPKEAREYFEIVKETVELANTKISNANSPHDLATPTAEGCSFCNKRIVCKAFQALQFDLALERPVRVVAGNLLGTRAIVGKTLLAAIQAGSEIKFEVEIDRNVIEEVPTGASIVISELQKRGSRLSCTRNSRVYLSH